MCISPRLLNNGALVECRNCWQCRENRINDWIGRCIAETKTCTVAHSVTLTYGRDDDGNVDHPRAAVLTYSDVQKYFKLLRKHGHPLRYFAVGEYGSMKGRSHWHLMTFWQSAPPKVVLDRRFDEEHWRHGHSFFEKPSPKSIRYICKYIQKDIGAAERQGYVAMSRRPPLGREYFMKLAQRYVDAGLSPQEPYYSFAEALDHKGDKIRFKLSGASAEHFCETYLRLWAKAHGGHYPVSDMLDAYLDSKARSLHDTPIMPDAGWLTHRGDFKWQREYLADRDKTTAEKAAEYAARSGR